MKKKIVGIFVMTLLIATAFSSLGLAENKIENNFDDYEIVMFIQEPDIPENEPLYASSDINDIWEAYDDFWGLPSPIREVHWWNIGSKWVGNNCYPSDPEGAVFTITFCEDDGTGKPGDIVCTYENVMPEITGTGIMYEYPSEPNFHGTFELYTFKAVLSSSCDLSDGWVSIVKTDSIHDYYGSIQLSKDGNDFMMSYNLNAEQWWYGDGYDLSFSLIGYIPVIHSEGSLSWTDVKTGETLTGTITVENTGGPGTQLDWMVSSNMEWGDWTFSPESGDDLKPEDGPVTVTVTVIAPDEKNKEFTGEVKILNFNDFNDYITIPVTLSTSKCKLFANPFIQFLENHPYLFPLLRQLLDL
jgi:hypothetical protein